MSADNGLLLDCQSFEVSEYCASTGYTRLIKKCKSLEEAVKTAKEYSEENIVEYGIDFIN